MNKTQSTREVCSSLIEEHRQMERLLEKLRQSLNGLNVGSHSGLEALKAIMGQVEAEMNTHFACEEEALFPAVSPYHPMVLMEVEHEELIALRDALLTIVNRTEVTQASMAQLHEMGDRFINDLLDHIGREDAGIFPACERALSDDEKADVIARMVEIRQNSLQSPTPSIQRPERSFQCYELDLETSPQRPISSSRLFGSSGREAKHITIQAGQSLAAHWTPKQVVLVCLAGEGTFHAGEQSVELTPGTVLTIDAQLKHGISAKTDCHLLLLFQEPAG